MELKISFILLHFYTNINLVLLVLTLLIIYICIIFQIYSFSIVNDFEEILF